MLPSTHKGRNSLLTQGRTEPFALQSLAFASGSFMVVAEDVRALRMAEDGSADADLPECDCDVTRQASS